MLKLSLLSLILISTSCYSCHTLQGAYDFYVGADAGIRKMSFKKNFGESVFKSPHYEELNIFLGCKINENFGVEGGYELSETKLESKIAQNGSLLFGVPLANASPGFDNVTNFLSSKSKVNGFNINLVGFLPITTNENISLIGSAGVGYLKNNVTLDLSEVGEKNIAIFDEEHVPVQKFVISRSKYKKYTATIRLNSGIQYLAKNNFGIRALAGWENTHKAKIQGKDRITGNKVSEHAKFKDSLIFRVGVFVPF